MFRSCTQNSPILFIVVLILYFHSNEIDLYYSKWCYRLGKIDIGKVKEMELNNDISGLIDLLDYNEECIIRSNAAEALGEIGDNIAVDSLINSLNDEDYIVRGSAAWALGEINDDRAVEPLIKVLGDRDSDVRKFTAIALGNIGDSRAVESLLKRLNDKCSTVRENVI